MLKTEIRTAIDDHSHDVRGVRYRFRLQWAALEKAFPTGVCDWSKPGVEQQDTIPWQTYQSSDGSVVYGGRSLGRAPARSGGGWTSGAFAGWRAARTG